MEDLLYKIALTKVPNVGAVSIKNLISYCGSAEAVFKANKRMLLKVPGIGAATAKNIQEQKVLSIAEQELRFIEKEAVKVLFYADEAYPNRLKHYNDSPALLYYKGTTDLNTARFLGVVGTRKTTTYGIRVCEQLIQDLSHYGVVVLSGLAYGVDITAHRKALAMGMETVGVLGSGLGQIYPSQHNKTARQMMQQGGILTEYTSQTGPDREHFPTRNRIIAGLCDALVVIETARKGGSIISANKAFEYNKDIFAVPGRTTDNFSSGCNHLIKVNKAQLLESAADIITAMNWDTSTKVNNPQRQLFNDLSAEEEKIIAALKGKEYLTIDTLSFESGFQNSKLAAILLTMEFKGIVKALPGKRYLLIR